MLRKLGKVSVVGTVLSLAALGVTACSQAADGSHGGDAEDGFGHVSLELSYVPGDVQCIAVDISGATKSNRRLPIDPQIGTGPELDLGPLAAGQTQFKAATYNVPCSSVDKSSATWIADSVSTRIQPGVMTDLALTFRPNNDVKLSANFVGNILGFSENGRSRALVMSDGTLRHVTAAGDGSYAFRPWYSAPPDVAQVAEFDSGACFLKRDGSVWCSGTNVKGVLGTSVAIGATSEKPVQIQLPAKAIELAAGSDFVCAVAEPVPDSDNLYCWGDNSYHQLSSANFAAMASPVGVHHADSVAAARNSLCSLSAAEIYCQGDNSSGQLGNPNLKQTLSDFGLSAAVGVSIGEGHACAWLANGSVKCWGQSISGAIGVPETDTPITTPTLVPGLDHVVQVTVGYSWSCALRTDGSVWCWGEGESGELGDAAGLNRPNPQPVPGLTRVVSLAANEGTACALKDDQTVWCWGENDLGQVGDGTTVMRFSPVQALVE